MYHHQLDFPYNIIQLCWFLNTIFVYATLNGRGEPHWWWSIWNSLVSIPGQSNTAEKNICLVLQLVEGMSNTQVFWEDLLGPRMIVCSIHLLSQHSLCIKRSSYLVLAHEISPHSKYNQMGVFHTHFSSYDVRLCL